MNIRSLDWEEFSEAVHEHIETYTIPQYGDKGEDPATDYDVEDCIRSMKKYLARQGKNSRDGQDSLDLIKIAHYAQMAFTLIGEQEDAKK
jgi:hypothetical protein